MKTFNIHKLIISTMKDAVINTVKKHDGSDGLITPNGKLVGVVEDNRPEIIFIEYKTELRSKFVPFIATDGIKILRKERKMCEHEDEFINTLIDKLKDQCTLVDEPVYTAIQRLMRIREILVSGHEILLTPMSHSFDDEKLLPVISHNSVNRLVNIVNTYGVSGTITLMEDKVDYIDVTSCPNGDIIFRTSYGAIKLTAEYNYSISIILNNINVIKQSKLTEENLDTASIYINRAIILITTNIESYLDDIETTWKLDELP